MAPERRVSVSIDGRPKVIDRALADFLRLAPVQEPGVLMTERRGKAA